MNLTEIKAILQAKEITNHISIDIEVNSIIASDLMSDVLHANASAELLLTGLANNQAVRTCEIAGIKAIIFVRGKSPPIETIKLAEECNIPLLTCEYSMFEACGILYSKGLKTPK
ncbi:MAG: transcriptional regulator [candidate division WOR-3 bacterium]